MKTLTLTWLFFKFEEKTPVFYGHVTYDAKTYTGPWYAPGSRFCQGIDTPKNRKYVETKKDHWEQMGYTVTIETETHNHRV